MQVGSFKFHRRAFSVLNQLAPEEKTQVLDRLTTLADIPAARWPGTLAKRLPGDQPLDLVRVNDSLRIMIRIVDGQPPEVVDIVRQETLASFAKAAARNGD